MRDSRTAASLLLGALACVFATGDAAFTEDAPAFTAEQTRFFEGHIRPLLTAKCVKCHGPEKQKGELRVDSREALLHGGETGPAIAAGQPGESLLVEAINYQSLEMPPDGKLSADEIGLLTKWVELGAPWTAGDAPPPALAQGRRIAAEDRNHWCYQPLRHPDSPTIAGDNWSRTDIDRFILARLAAEGLAPQAEADRVTLLRRITQVVTGLPPTLAEIDAFLADDSATSYEMLVDRLLGSPRRGEQLARFWLDLVRYADSDGYKADGYRPTAWRYRDYVISSFNADKPFDRFLLEQLAGDEIDPRNPEAIAATGYFRNGIYEYNNRDAEGQWRTITEDITETTADAFLAMGLGCAKCHDHKFDPLLQTDYYRFQAFFWNLSFQDDQRLSPDDVAEWEAFEAKQKVWEKATETIREELELIEGPIRKKVADGAVKQFPPEIQEVWNTPPEKRTAHDRQIMYLVQRQIDDALNNKFEKAFQVDDDGRRDQLLAQLAQYDGMKPEPPASVLAVTDVALAPSPLYVNGKPRLGAMEPAAPEVLCDEPLAILPTEAAPHSTGRRAALANWLIRPDHPLTSRVIVNRLWQQMFGAGLVASTSDFGRLGEQPSHPELLDWLATEFVAHGWSIRWLQREILLSAVFRQSSGAVIVPSGARLASPLNTVAADPNMVDPANRLLWRYPVRRLTGEQIRDAALAVSEELDLTAGGPGADVETPRRSIYLKVLRNRRDELLAQFDFPDRIVSVGERNVTTTPTQSLLLINSSWMQARAKQFQSRLESEFSGPADSRIRAAYRLAFGRDPTEQELIRAVDFLESRDRETASSGEGPLFDLLHVLLNSNEFLYVD